MKLVSYFLLMSSCLFNSLLPIALPFESKVSPLFRDETKERVADLIVFSFNRPMQLYSFCESSAKKIVGLRSATVIYRASNERYEQGYAIVKRDFPHVAFIKQACSSANDFKPLLIKAFQEGSGTHIIFAVDDILVLEPVDLSWCAQRMDEENAYGFYLRLGENIIRNYTLQQSCGVPVGSKNNGLFSWRFIDGKGDWMISHSVDMTLFRKKDLEKWVLTLDYYSPNTFEGQLINVANLQAKGICCTTSKIVNIPLNIVQEQTTHRHMNLVSSDELLEEFLSGYKIDIASFDGMLPQAPHMAWIPKFIPFPLTRTI